MRTIIICILLAIIFRVDGMAQQDSAYHLQKVLIDAGHGGKDPGALGKVSKEKDLALSIALKLGHYIDSLTPGVKVMYTRTTDKFLTLKERAELTNSLMPDLFISIHINSCRSSKVKGFSTYINGTGKDKDQIEIQKKENGGEEMKDEDIISMKNTQTSNHSNSALFAQKIQDQFRLRTDRKSLGVKEATFAVLWRAYMPAVLIECGYISNRDEENYLKSEYGQFIVASAIFRAFREYKNEVESHGKSPVQTKPAAEPKNSTPSEPKKEKTQPANKNGQENEPAKNNATPTNSTAAGDNKIYFRVQIKSNAKPIPLNSKEFKGLKNIEEIKIDGIYKYTIGKTQNYNEITKILKDVKQKINDAFPIATKGDKKIEIPEAKKALNQ